MMFEPIAIVGRACVLPGASSSEELWQAVIDRRDLTTAAPAGAWGARGVRVTGGKSAGVPDVVTCDRGGYVSGFEALFDPAGFGVDAERIQRLDESFRWLLHCAREALNQGRVSLDARPRTGLVVGNLSYPSRGLADLACATWLADPDASGLGNLPAENRFVSGLPAQFTARALGLGGPAFALDAACASSLYAIKAACDLLHDRTCDVVLSGGLNHADSLFLQVGFTTLSALSASGRSRPLTENADGLLPAEGAALLTLKRLDDAVAAGDRIFAVIRGVGLSNDGRERGLLAPDGKGQIRAMRQAFDVCGIAPESIGYVECHATGTTVGDSEEVRSMATLFGGKHELPVGALKANLGHLITASGAAAVLKVMAAFENRLLPPTIDAEQPLGLIARTPLRLLSRAESWQSEGPRRAGINAFGFGGNNAHLILEEPPLKRASRAVPVSVAEPEPAIAICGIGVALGDAPDLGAFVARLREPAALAGDSQIRNVVLPGKNLRFPPADLRRSLGQQTLAMNVAFQALAGVKAFDAMKCGVYFGMGCDPEVARWALRWRLTDLLAARGLTVDDGVSAVLRDQAADALTATSVVGTMPNIPANRLSAQFDLRGPAFTVSAEELSGVEALRLARRALSRREIDAAVVGAVDLSCEPVHQRAVARLLPAGWQDTADGAVVLVLKREEDARAAGDRILAILPAGSDGRPAPRDAALRDAIARRFGRAHAASGLLEILGAIVETQTRSNITESGLVPAIAAPAKVQRLVRVAAFAGQQATIDVAGAAEASPLLRDRSAVQLRCYGADTRAGLLAALDVAAGATTAGASHRLAVVGRGHAELEARIAECRFALTKGEPPKGRGIHFQEGPALGKAALVFAGANTYRDMGKEFFLTFPEIGDALAQRFPIAEEVARDLYGPAGDAFIAQPFGALKAASLLCQAHALVADRILGLTPQAALGLSSGETNALFAFDAWRDMTGMFDAVGRSGLYDRHLAGHHEAARTQWGLDDKAPLGWKSWLIAAPVTEVAGQLQGIDRAAISIVLSPTLCIVGGTDEACEALIGRIGKQRAVEQTPTLICHSTVLEPFAATWAAIHDRETRAVPGLSFYGQAHNGPYDLTRESVRDALLAQARRPIDFSATVERAWQDGVRIFVEAGPRNILSRSIGETLKERPHLALALDDGGRSPGEHLAAVAARLFAAGASLDVAALARCFNGPDAEPAGQARLMLTLPARMSAFDAAALKNAKPMEKIMESPPEPPQPSTITPLFAAPSAPPDGLHVFSREWQARSAEVHRLRPREAAAAARAPELEPEILPPPYDRKQLEELAGGRISAVFGARFRGQDHHLRQVRMPMPPLLLADRVVSIDAAPGVLGKGSIVTETDVTADAWYIDEGRMPLGLLIEAGQADLLLISWMGIDDHNRGERAYRLLGCDITFHEGGMPSVGDTLSFNIHVDGHAQLGDVRMFFFGYECRVGDRLVSTVRNGQAGFFSDAELAAAKGVNWTPPAPLSQGQGELPVGLRPSTKAAFSAADLAAFSSGDALRCFGAGFEQAAAHQRTPKLPAGRMRMIDEVSRFEPRGGPRGLGYLEATAQVPVDSWFYDGHFLNDPCMPGTLMADAAVQALSFHMAALGMTVNRDGWRFEPVTGEAFKFVCRGQVVPDRPHALRYEVFVEEIVDGPNPTIYATLLCTCDGLKVFHCARFGLRLVPDWPVSTRRQWLDGAEEPRVVGVDSDVRGDNGAMLACAWGAPSTAFGINYARFDHEGRVPRLPGPPYLFVSRIRSVSGPGWRAQTGLSVIAEYDVPPDAWYFRDNDRLAMPFAVLNEVLLQPCGWLASYAGITATGKAFLRNLDGSEAIQHLEVTPDLGTLTVSATLTRVVRLGELSLTFFKVECHAGSRLVCSMTTSFGIFTAGELAKQAGLTVKPETRAFLTEAPPADFRAPDLSAAEGALGLPSGRLRMIEQVTGFWPATGEQPGRIRCRRGVSPHDWYFKAHFYEDPVQPGSLGLEALLQSLKAYLILAGHGRDLATARFEPIALGQPLTWKYRGQITPERQEIVTTLTVRITETPTEVLAVAEGVLWADGLPIYEVSNLAVRIAGKPAPLAHRLRTFTPSAPAWVADHCPTYTRPALPFMTLVPQAAAVAARASGRTVIAIEDLQVLRWMPVPADGLRLIAEARAQSDADLYQIRLLACQGADDRPLRAVILDVGTGQVRLGEAYPDAPAPWAPLEGLTPVADPYGTASLFHGPAFRLQRELRRGSTGASSFLSVPVDAGLSDEDRDVLVLDAALHAVPHDEPELWLGDGARGMVAYPERIAWMRFYGPLPRSGSVAVETRLVPTDDGKLCVRTQLRGDRVLMEMEHVERLLPKGPLGTPPPGDRRRFLAERAFVEGMGLADHSEGETTLSMAAVHRSNWLPGTLEAAYRADGPLPALTASIAVKEHLGRRHRLHPSWFDVAETDVACRLRPFERFGFSIKRDGAAVRVSSPQSATLDFGEVSRALAANAGLRPSVATSFLAALVCRTFGRVEITEAAFSVLCSRQSLCVEAPATDSLGSLAMAVLLAALTGRGSDLIEKDGPAARGQALAALLGDCPLARHEPLLAARPEPTSERHAIATDALPIERPVLRFEWIADPSARSGVRIATSCDARGRTTSTPVQVTWPDVVAMVEEETGFVLSGEQASREQPWIARLAGWPASA